MNRLFRNTGVTLIELMISMVIGLLISAAIMTLYVNNKETYRTQEDLSRLQENGRFALEFLARDIRLADYWGCAQSTAVTNNLNGVSQGRDFSNAITGVNGAAPGAADKLHAPDSITIAEAFGPPIPVTATMANISATLTVAANNLTTSDVVIVSDCAMADIFRVTASGTDLGHVAGSQNNENATALFSTIYGPNAQVYRVRSVTYSIGTNPAVATNNTTGLFPTTSVPHLRITDPDNNNASIIENVENMQILYGEDTDIDGTANRYLAADTVTDMANVVSVRINLLLRTEREINDSVVPVTFAGVTVSDPGDKISRRVFTTTVSLRNRIP